ncbi:enoyl-CoA hydratase [Williamsia sp. 1135]|uniref:enoyl-CoA hydratase n=1 Tax=Williamsia sp. 1135 TaxID=1889262 RepID=UPI000A1209E3|nr:enoyl-CoA hydratase [Williamsia sp. 1135]ORM32803.1 enoyl-CoA hydratase [Williamsia sp. 1135]
MTTFETITTEQRGRVGIITLNRPKALNALNSQLMAEVVSAAQAYDTDPSVGAIVITGSERAFAAGADIKEMSEKTYVDMLSEDFFSAWGHLVEVRTPVIAAVAGFALGGGCELAMMCDIIIAAENAVFGQPEINLGVIPGIGGSQRLTRAIGKAKAMDMVLTGRRMKVDEAERAGLVSRVVPTETYLEDAIAVATTISELSLPITILAKQAVNRSQEVSLAEGILFERRVFHSTFATEDQTEGMAAFVEKRDANFSHR